MFNLKELRSNLLLIILKKACSQIGSSSGSYNWKGIFELWKLFSGYYSHEYLSWAPYQLPADVYFYVIGSLRLGYLCPFLLDLHHRLLRLGPVLAPFWFHSRTWHFIPLLVSLSYLPQDWDFRSSVLCSHKLIITRRPNPIPGLSPAPNWRRTVNDVYGIFLNVSVLFSFIPN